MRLASWAHKTMIAMREYLNEGGKAIVAGRNIHQWPTGSTSLTATGPYQWAPDKVLGLLLPGRTTPATTTCPGTAFQRYRGISNDTWQNYLGVVGAPGRLRAARRRTRRRRSPSAGGLFDGMAPIAIDQAARATTRTRTPTAPRRRGRSWRRGCATGAASPSRSRCARSGWSSTSRPRRRRRAGSRSRPRDTVTFGFGLEQVPARTRNELVARAMAHLLPTTADTAAPLRWRSSGRRPTAFAAHAARPGRGRRDRRRRARRHEGGPPPGRRRAHRDQPRRSRSSSAGRRAPGRPARRSTLTAEAVDKAGNVATATRTVDVTAVAADVEAPLPVGKPGGRADAGSTLTCVERRVPQRAHECATRGSRRRADRRRDGARYTLTAAELGRQVRCRITASNSAATPTRPATFVSVAAVPGPRVRSARSAPWVRWARRDRRVPPVRPARRARPDRRGRRASRARWGRRVRPARRGRRDRQARPAAPCWSPARCRAPVSRSCAR